MSEWSTSHLKELFESRLDSYDKALELQASEYERRLETLNHDHENTRRTQSTYVAIAVYDAEKREWDNRVRNLEKFQNNLTGRLVVVGSVVAVLATLLGGILMRSLRL